MRKLLLSQDLQSITQILRFRLYEHKNSLQQVLDKRWDYKLGEILIELLPARLINNPQAVTKLSKDQKIEAILRLVEPTPPPSPVCWSWKPCNAINETDAVKIAAEIDEEFFWIFIVGNSILYIAISVIQGPMIFQNPRRTSI